MAIEVLTSKLDGSDLRWLGQLGQIANWKHTKNFPGGSSSASFDFIYPPDAGISPVQGNRRLVAFSGSSRIFTGRTEQPTRGNPWQVTAVGNGALGKAYQVYVTGGATANVLANLNAAIDRAIGQGLPWTRAGLIGPAPAGGMNNNTGSVDDALGHLVSCGLYWSVDDYGNVVQQSAAPAAGYLLGVTDLPGRTLNGYFNCATVSYTSSTNHTTGYATVYGSSADRAAYGDIYAPIDLTSSLAELSLAQATAVAAAILANVSLVGMPWTDGFRVGPGQLFSLGGGQVTDLSTIDANITVRLVALSLSASTVDVPIGQVDYDDQAGTLTLTPVAASLDDFIANLARSRGLSPAQP